MSTQVGRGPALLVVGLGAAIRARASRSGRPRCSTSRCTRTRSTRTDDEGEVLVYPRPPLDEQGKVVDVDAIRRHLGAQLRSACGDGRVGDRLDVPQPLWRLE